MNQTWSLVELQRRIGNSNIDKDGSIVDLIKSIGRSIDIFDYHIQLARDAFNLLNPEEDRDGSVFTRHLLMATRDTGQTIRKAALQSEANLIACVNITKSMFDSFGQLVNQIALSEPIPRNPYLKDVIVKLPASTLRGSLEIAISSDWYLYVSAFINTVKHRQLITHSASISFVDGNRGGRLKEFSYNKKDYPSYWATEVLEGIVELQRLLIHCGQALNTFPIPKQDGDGSKK